jgi:hypothetical protein
MRSSREYWQYARKCARWAKEAQNKEDHDVMVDMAKAWTYLALADSDVAKAVAREAFAEEAERILNS